MPREVLKIKEFVVLHNAILQHYAEECKAKGVAVPKKQGALYGFGGKHKKSDYSVLAMMKATPAIITYLKQVNEGQSENETGFQELNGKNLYNKFLETQNESVTEIVLSEPYSVIYPLYIDCKDLEAFKEKYNLKQHFDNYIGYYYSQRDNEVKEFQFQMAYANGECEAITGGFHEGRRQDPFTGRGSVKSNNLFINFINKEGIELKIIIPTEGNQLQSQHYLMGVLTTITGDNFPISVRIFLVRLTNNLKKVPEEDAYKIKRYLNLQRQNLRAPNERITDLKELAVRDEQIENLELMIGTYLMWRYVGADILQIKIVIGMDFSIQVLDDLYSGTYADQIGKLNSSRNFHHNLCISTFPKRGSQQVLSYYLIEIPQGQRWKYLKGIYSNVGNPEHKPSGGAIALYKEQEGESLELQPQIINKDDISEFLDDYPELVQLKTMLDIQAGTLVK
jgi:hypothetical protein